MAKFRKAAIGLLFAAAIILGGFYCYLLAQAAPKEAGNITIVQNIDQTEAMKHPRFIKEEYVPVIPEGVNIALDAKMQTNAFNEVYTARKAVDGKTGGTSYWEGESNAYPNILTASFKEAQSIHAIKVSLCPLPVWSQRKQNFSVEISEDGETFTVLKEEAEYQFDPDTGNEVILEFDDVTVKSVQLVFTGNTGASGGQVAEFEIYSR